MERSTSGVSLLKQARGYNATSYNSDVVAANWHRDVAFSTAHKQPLAETLVK